MTQNDQEVFFRLFYCGSQDAEARAFLEKTGWHLLWGSDPQGLNGDTWIIFRSIEDLPKWLQDYAREEGDYEHARNKGLPARKRV